MLVLVTLISVFSSLPPSFAVRRERLIYNDTLEVERRTFLHPPHSGPLSGLIVTRRGVNVTTYLAIPYAKKPLGVRRFADPQPLSPWNGKSRE